VLQRLDVCLARAVELDIDSFEHSVQVCDEVRIPKTDYAVTLALQPRLSLLISFGVLNLAMMPTIELDDESFRRAEKVYDINTDRCLPSEMRAKRRDFFQGAP
jgi:hypothetical protein